MQDFDYVRTFRDQTWQSTSWIQAAFYIGLARWASATGDAGYFAALHAKAVSNEWRIGPLDWHADDQAIAQAYLAIADRFGDARIGPVREAFDRILESPPVNSLEFRTDDAVDAEGSCQRRWCWCDALFMAPPAWAMLSNATGDARYREHAVREYFATKEYLYDENEHLFYRDSRFFTRRTPYGNKVFWSRGNGWVFAGLPLLLEALPPSHPVRPELLRLYREMAAKFRSIQGRDGFWSPSLLDVAHDPRPETSGTAFITFGLAWGINNRIIDGNTYQAAALKGWQAISSAVNEDGRLGWVQQVGNAPDEVRATDTQLYGSGAFLLAASEVLRLPGDALGTVGVLAEPRRFQIR
jgi:rhamnogalacturonyl hydrolase YesR